MSGANHPTPEGMTPKEIAAKVIDYLMRPEVRERLAREQVATDAYFKRLRKQTTPSWEDLQRPFDV